jgi:signal transduction histidine kinase
MSRITSGKLRLDVQREWPAGFIEAALDTVQPAAEAKGVRLETRARPGRRADRRRPGRLQQVVWNLLSNAIKFTPRAARCR